MKNPSPKRPERTLHFLGHSLNKSRVPVLALEKRLLQEPLRVESHAAATGLIARIGLHAGPGPGPCFRAGAPGEVGGASLPSCSAREPPPLPEVCVLVSEARTPSSQFPQRLGLGLCIDLTRQSSLCCSRHSSVSAPRLSAQPPRRRPRCPTCSCRPRRATSSSASW